MAPSTRSRWVGRLTTVRVRLTVLAVLIVGLGLVVGAVVVLTLVRQSLIRNAVDTAAERARDTAAMLQTGETPMIFGEEPVQVVDRAGRVLASSQNLAGRPPLVGLWPPEGGVVEASLHDLPIGDADEYVMVGVAVSLNGEPVAVYAACSLEPATEGVEATGSALAIAVPVLLALVAGTSWLLVGRALRPVEAMRSQVAEITASQLDRRVPEPAVQDEIGRLAQTMNEMLGRLQEAHERQRRFVADAAHELRSPLTAILTQLEVGLARPADTDWVALARQAHREGLRLDRLADDLLTLSRTDAAAGLGPPEMVDLDELVLAEVEAVRARGKVSVELSPFSAARLSGRPDELRGVVRNLLDNAERHARQSVVVGLSATDGVVDLVVADDGDGIPEPDRERVFDRFVRLQPARDRDSGGTGLGLAIVRDVVASHGGSVWVADSDAGAEVHVRLPLVTPPAPAE